MYIGLCLFVVLKCLFVVLVKGCLRGVVLLGGSGALVVVGRIGVAFRGIVVLVRVLLVASMEFFVLVFPLPS